MMMKGYYVSIGLLSLGDFEDSLHKVEAEFLEAKLADHLLLSLVQLGLLARKHLPHVLSPFLFGFAEISAALADGFPWAAAVVSDDWDFGVHRFDWHNAEVLVFRCVEHALCVPKKIFAGFIGDGSVEMNQF